MKSFWLLALLAISLFLPRPAMGLEADQVLVVVNANAEGSVELGKYYCLARSVPEGRTVTLKTAAGYHVSRAAYDKEIAAPLREFLVANKLQDKIACIVLMYGVPVRVQGREPIAQANDVATLCRGLSQKADGRFAIDLAMLKTVTLSYPQPKSEGLEPLSALFEPPPADAGDKAQSLGAARGGAEEEFKKRLRLASALTDAGKRQIALRQLAALRRDTHGLAGLLAELDQYAKVSGVPSREELSSQVQALEKELAGLQNAQTPEDVRKAADLQLRLHGAIGMWGYCQGQLAQATTDDEDAAVDSELSLLWEENPASLHGFRPNALNWRFLYAGQKAPNLPAKMVMACRIDGPSAKDALRIVKDSVFVENDKEKGLTGKFYIDSGWPQQPGPGYAECDRLLLNLAEIIKRTTTIPVVLDTSPAVFAEGACPDAALYVGWYSLRKYVPAFTWARGAVGWHIASFEAEDLRNPKSDTWCVKMIQNGVTATLGPVNEPYLAAFPLPHEFFGLLLTGKYTAAECYWRTVPFTSWRMSFIADPLYNPFKLHPQLDPSKLPPEWKGPVAATAPAK
jgi:uncharacterized protein (TIGR03790 family)